MIYQEIQPAEALKNYIHSYWRFEVDAEFYKEPFMHSIMADGCTSLAFIKIPGVPVVVKSLTGPTVSNIEVQVYPGMVAVGVRFLPPAQFYLLGIEGAELRDKDLKAESFSARLDLDEHLVHLSDKKIFSLFDMSLKEYLEKTDLEENFSVNNAVSFIIKEHGKVKVSDVVKQSAMSERHLQREFKRLVGLTLKEFARVRRIRSTTIEMLTSGEKTSAIIDKAGYFDRSHFNSEFSLIVGNNPSGFKKYIDQINHIDLTRD